MIDSTLEELMPPDNIRPAVLHQAMRYSVLGGGKRLRPVMALEAAEILGGDVDEVMPAACAIELIHSYSLIHDDLPVIDNDDFRRGKLSNHKVFGEAIALLAGDALLTMAFELLAGTATRKIPAERALRTVLEVALATGSQGLVGGQVVDVQAAGTRIDHETVEYICRNKTGALFRVAIRTGAILAGAGEKVLAALTDYADNFGILFQITDDLIDYKSDASKVGGRGGVNMTGASYPLVMGLEDAENKAFQAAEGALFALKRFGSEADFLRYLIDLVLKRGC